MSSATIIPIVFCASLEPCEKEKTPEETSCNRRNQRSTTLGDMRKQIHRTIHINRSPNNNPTTGERTMAPTILLKPAYWTAARPDCATAAPAKPPIKACEELVGRPHHQVIKSQIMAPTRSEER